MRTIVEQADGARRFKTNRKDLQQIGKATEPSVAFVL